MAIQKINLGTEPLGEGGDTYRSANTKINENFSNTAHAASRLVGTENGNLVEMKKTGVAETGIGGTMPLVSSSEGGLPTGAYYLGGSGAKFEGGQFVLDVRYTDTLQAFRISNYPYTNRFFLHGSISASASGGVTNQLREGAEIYHSGNITKDKNSNLLLESGASIPTTSAASKLVGDVKGRIPLWQDTLPVRTPLRQGSSGNQPEYPTEEGFNIATDTVIGYKYFWNRNSPSSWAGLIDDVFMTGWQVRGYAQTGLQIAFDYRGASEIIFRTANTAGNYRTANNGWVKVYTTGNTTKDTATGFLKASSPILHVYNDSITKIHEAEQLDITVDKKGVGHYEIHGTTGLRKNDGWFMSPPRDVHGNVLCMVDLEEKDGVVILKTYKKMFDFETVSIVHDYDNPMDIPEGVCVEFRFNDLPMEDTAEPEPVDEPIVEEEEVEPEVVEEEPSEEPIEESE